MHRGSTPRITFEFNIPLYNLTEMNLSLSQKGNIVLEKNISDVEITDEHTMILNLTEDETLMFETDEFNNAYIDVQFRLAFGEDRCASDIMQIIIKPIIKEGKL